MTDLTDWQLIRKYSEGERQAAFSALVRRHTDLVYCTCLRELGEPSLAEDAAQAVFLILARKATSFRPGTTLSSWLFQTALLTSKNVSKRERRRQAREQRVVAGMEQAMPTPPRPSGWEEMEPLLNEALEALPTAQRGLVLERFLEDRPLAEIGAARGISEDAARMRLNRALDRLRRFLAARNVVLSAAALAALLPQAVRPAPAHCAESILRLALPPAASDSPVHVIAQGAIHTMNLKRLQLLIGAAALVAALSFGTAGAVRVHTRAEARAAVAAKRLDQAKALAILDRMYATYAALPSFRCEVSSQEVLTRTDQEATYEIQRPNKIRFHRATLLGADGTGRAAAVSDGTSLYVTSTEGNGLSDRYAKILVTKSTVPGNGNNSVGSLFSNFGGLTGYGTETFAGMPSAALGVKVTDWTTPQQSAPRYSLGQPVLMDEQVNSHLVKDAKVDVVNVQRDWVAPPPPGFAWQKPTRVTYYIGQRDHLLYKMTVASVTDSTHTELIRTENIEDFDIAPKLPASDFVFTPPPGSHEVSNTDGLFPDRRK